MGLSASSVIYIYYELKICCKPQDYRLLYRRNIMSEKKYEVLMYDDFNYKQLNTDY